MGYGRCLQTRETIETIQLINPYKVNYTLQVFLSTLKCSGYYGQKQRKQTTGRKFDSTLGYPGEGPGRRGKYHKPKSEWKQGAESSWRKRDRDWINNRQNVVCMYITGIEDTIAAEVMIAGDMSTLFVLANQLSTATQWTTLLVVCLLLLGWTLHCFISPSCIFPLCLLWWCPLRWCLPQWCLLGIRMGILTSFRTGQACSSVSKRFQALDWLLTAHKYIIGFQN